MKFSHVLALGLIISLSPLSSQAQTQSGGMKTLYVGRDTNAGATHTGSPSAQEQANQVKKDALSKALEKYEKLSAGVPDASQEQSKTTVKGNALPVVAPQRIQLPSDEIIKTQQPQPKAESMSGFAGILQEYKDSKKSRSQMRTKTITP